MSDFVVLHRHGCRCVADPWSDSDIATMPCNLCDQDFGYGVPIATDEGQFTRHLSCELFRASVMHAWHSAIDDDLTGASIWRSVDSPFQKVRATFVNTDKAKGEAFMYRKIDTGELRYVGEVYGFIARDWGRQGRPEVTT